MGAAGAAGGLSAGAKIGIAIASVAAVAGVGGIAFVATDGFGMLAESAPSSESAPAQSDPGEEEIVPGERQEDEVVGDPNASGMDLVFESGRYVQCTYTFEGYDATTTMKTRDTFRIDQQTQGGLAHVIRGPQTTVLWVDGMTAAEQYDTDVYESQAQRFPTFNPDDFDTASYLDPTVCVELRDLDATLFTLPNGMTTTPGMP